MGDIQVHQETDTVLSYLGGQQTDSVPVHRSMLEVMYIKWFLTTDQYNLQ
jgi:hypothetical protein